MTASERISADLAIVARASRARPISIETTLRRVGAIDELPGDAVEKGPVEQAGRWNIALVAMARVFALRVARIAAGAYVIACVLGSIAYTLVPAQMFRWGQLDDILSEDRIVSYVGAMALVYVIAMRIAHAWFRRALARAAEPYERGRRLVDRVDPLAIALGIGGVMTFAVWYLTARREGLVLWFRSWFDEDWTEVDAVRSLAPLIIAILASLLAAIRVARSREGRLPRWVLPIAVPAFAILLVDAQYYFDLVPAVAAVSAVPLFVIVAAWQLARRRNEAAAMEAS